MGDMVFGGGFELMREGDTDGVWQVLQRGMRDIALLAHIPWFSGIFFGLQSLRPPTKSAQGILRFAMNCVMKRKKQGSLAGTKDMFYYLVEEPATPPNISKVISDAVLSIIAGSDTTTTTLCNILYYVLSDPHTLQRLREEIDSVFPPGEANGFEAQKLAEMPYLNAVINEGMRLQPVVASGSQRAPWHNTGGKMIGSHYIPEGTAISIPAYTIHCNPRYFSPYPDRFIPERWLRSKPRSQVHLETGDDFLTNLAAFLPFSYGPTNCVGKSLALVEMRLIVAMLIQGFDMRLAPGFSAEEWQRDLRDMFLLTKGSLPVVLSIRGGSEPPM